MNKIANVSIVIVILAILVMAYLLNFQNSKISDLRTELELARGYATGNIIPEDVLHDIEILKNSITEIRRLGPDTVIVTERYIPSESEVHYIAEIDTFTWSQMQDILEQLAVLEMNNDTTGLAELRATVDKLKYSLYTTSVEFDTYGTCLEPTIGLGANEHGSEEVVVGVRLLYANRYGIGLQGAVSNFTDTDSLELGIGGFGDARIPYFENVGGYIGGGYNFTQSEWNFRVGLQGYLN